MSGGNKNGRRSPADNPRIKAADAADDCDLVFEVDLAAIRVPIGQLTVGAALDVALVQQGGLEAAICRLPNGSVVGSLAAFQGLALLIDCMRRGNRYAAEVVRIGRGVCRVKVRRISK